MAQQSNDVVQKAGPETSSRRKSDFRLSFLHKMRPGKKHGALPNPPNRSPGQSIRDGSQVHLAESRGGGPGHPVAQSKALTSHLSENEVVSGTNSHAVVENQHTAHQGDNSHAETDLGHDLWAKAWESRALTMEEKVKLAMPWEKLDSQNETLQDIHAREYTPRGTKSTEAGRKGVSKSNQPEYVRQVIIGAEKALQQRPWGPPDAPSTAGKVVDCVLMFKEFGDAIVKFDPSGYALSAWTVVAFGITVVGKDKQRMDEAFTASAYLAELLTRYGKIEAYYSFPDREIRGSLTGPLEAAIVDVYTAILKYSAAVKSATEGLLFERIVDALTKSEELGNLRKVIDEKSSIVKTWEEIVDRDFTKVFQKRTGRSLESIGKRVVEIVGVLGDVQEGVLALTEKETLEWLCPSKDDTSTERHNTIGETIDNGVPGNPGDVFVQKPEYRDWTTDPGQKVLWLHAPFGYGKSWLCYSIIQDLKKTCAPENPQRILLYWFFDKKTKDMKTVYRSFMRQLAVEVRDKFPEEIQTWLKGQHNGRVNWREQLGKWFKALKRHIFVVLDGLDEYSLGQSQPFKRQLDVNQLIATLFNGGNPYLHILVLSKDNAIVRRSLENKAEAVEEINIQGDLRQELDQFIARTMTMDDFFKNLKPALQEAIIMSLEKSEGKNFLWASSLLDELRGCSNDDIREKLQKVPSNMANKYKQELSLIPDKEKPSMKLIFMWLLQHKRKEGPLTATEVATAAKLESSRLDKLLDGVRTLVTISPSARSMKSARQEMDGGNDSDDDGGGDASGDGSSDDGYGDLLDRHVDFVHFSAKEYLKEVWAECETTGVPGLPTPARHWAQGLSFSDEEAHHDMTKRCLEILLKEEDAEDGNSKSSPLRDYAAEHWHSHYLDVAGHPEYSTATDAASTQLEHWPPTRGDVSELDEDIKQLLRPDSPAFKSWLDLYNPDEDLTLPRCEMGCKDEDQHHFHSPSDSESDRDSDSIDYIAKKRRADPVYYAVKLLLLDLTVQIIESQPAQTYIRAGSEGTVLQLALCHQHWNVVETLLKNCDDPKAAITAQEGPHGTPLYIAAAYGKDDIVENLIDKGARADGTKDGRFGSALHAAAYNGHTTTVKLLMEMGGGSVDQEGGVFGTALQAAAAQGHVETVRSLIDSHADPTRVCGAFFTALQAALAGGSDSATDTSIVLGEAIDKRGFDTANRSKIGWQSAFLQLQASSPSLLHQYASVFIPTGVKQQRRNHLGRPKQLVLLTVLEDWVLPGANDLSRCLEWATAFLYQAPAQEHLEDIRGTLPNFQECSLQHEMNKFDFFYKALFWSGINYILENLEPLMRPTMASLIKAVRSAGITPMRDGESLDDEAIERAELRWRRRRDFRFGLAYRRLTYRDWKLADDRSTWWNDFGSSFDDYLYPRSFRNVDMDLSDRIHREMARQQQSLREKPAGALEKTDLLSTSTTLSSISQDDSHDSNDIDSNGDVKDGKSNIEIHQVVDELLILLKEIVGFGKQCDQLHSNAASVEDAETIKKLTFEVFAAVVRLTVSLKDYNAARDTTIAKASFSQTVHLLSTVRLCRITRLAAAVTRKELPYLIQEKLTPILDSLRDQMCEQVSKQIQETVREAVQSELVRQGKAPPPQEKQRSRNWPGIF